MQRLLTKGIGHTKFKDSPLGEIPKNWEVVKLEQYSEKITDGSHVLTRSSNWNWFVYFNSKGHEKNKI